MAMLAVGRGSAMAMVEEAAMAAAEEVEDGWGGRRLRMYLLLFLPTIDQFFFSGVRFFGVRFF